VVENDINFRKKISRSLAIHGPLCSTIRVNAREGRRKKTMPHSP
jgi:hypothetical protein